jgi:hypothetical protein
MVVVDIVICMQGRSEGVRESKEAGAGGWGYLRTRLRTPPLAWNELITWTSETRHAHYDGPISSLVPVYWSMDAKCTVQIN